MRLCLLVVLGSVGAIVSEPLLAGTLCRACGRCGDFDLGLGERICLSARFQMQRSWPRAMRLTQKEDCARRKQRNAVSAALFSISCFKQLNPVHRIDIKPTLLSCAASNDTITFFSSLSAYTGPIPTVLVNAGFISGLYIHHMLFWLISVATLH